MHRATGWLKSVLWGAAALVIAAGVTTAQEDASVAQEDASVLVETPETQSWAGPELSPPANQPTLPPPEMPEAQRDASRKSEALPEPAPERRSVKRPFMRPAEPLRRESARAEYTAQEAAQRDDAIVEERIPGPEVSFGPAIDVRPAPPIKYDTDGDARRMYRRYGEIHVVMIAKNPADGCHYEIPMCIPGCCVGEPSVSGGRGLFGRGVVEFCWPCGFRAEVKFRQILGDVRVDYEGD